jgi:octaprenyl-diphosphate synthase
MLAAGTTSASSAHAAARTSDSTAEWQEIVEPVRPFLLSVAERLEAQVEQFEPEIIEHARYALVSRGKQLRPALVGLAAAATGGVADEHVTVAAIIEMIHLATLVHDDVMDDAQMRRQRPTLALRCGNSTSILLGDALFAHALTLAASFPTPALCRAVAAATKTVCSGEIIQTERRCQFELTREGYYRILRMKTAELFGLACEQGAVYAGADEAVQQRLREYGLGLGTAYQIYDDCLDLLGSEATAGKSLGTDLLSGKPTLPVLIALERANATEQAALKDLLADWHPESRPLLFATLERHQAITESGEVVRGMCEQAAGQLAGLPEGPARAALERATDFLVRQTARLTHPARP